MLPADLIAEIATNLSALDLHPNSAAQILAAVLAPLLRASPAPVPLPGPPERRRKRGGRPRARPKARTGRKRKYTRRARTDAREQAIAALRDHPDKTVNAIAKMVGCHRATVSAARRELAAEAREGGPKPKAAANGPDDRHQRAQQFLRAQLRGGPKAVSDVEEAAVKAHVAIPALESACTSLGVVTSRANTGGAHAVQWSLPG